MKRIMMQCTDEQLHKLNQKIIQELEKGEAYEVLGNEEIGVYYS